MAKWFEVEEEDSEDLENAWDDYKESEEETYLIPEEKSNEILEWEF